MTNRVAQGQSTARSQVARLREALLVARRHFKNMPSGAYDRETVEKHLKDGSPENAESFEAGMGIAEIDDALTASPEASQEGEIK